MLRKRSFTKRRGICRGPWSSMSRHAVTYRFRHEIKEFVPLPDYPRAAKPPAAHPKVPRPLSSGSSMDAPTDARDQTWPWVLRQRFGNQVHIGLAISGDTRRYTPPPMCGLEWSGKPVGPRQYETCLPLWSESVCLSGRQSAIRYFHRWSRLDRVVPLASSSCSRP